jgi:hypothetical protein
MNDDWPTGQRIFELAADAIRIKGARDFYENADRIMTNLDPVEKRFFQVLLGPDYIVPDRRGKYCRDLGCAGKEVIGPDILKQLLLDGDSMSLEEAQKAIDDHIKKHCVTLEHGTWPSSEGDPLPSYYEQPTYPSRSDDYDSHDWSVDIMAFDVLETHKAALDEVYQTGQGEFQPKGETHYHLVAKFSTQGTRWAIASFYLDDFDDWFSRTEIVEQFDSLEQAAAWLKSIGHKIERSTSEANEWTIRSEQWHCDMLDHNGGADDFHCLREGVENIKSSTLPEVDQSASDMLKLGRLLRAASAVPKIKSASERVIPTPLKETTHDIEMEL